MSKCHLILPLVWLLLCGGPLSADEQSWPGFRGDGTSRLEAEAKYPLNWSTENNIAWQVNLTGYGQSSPLIWGEQVFVTSADGPKKIDLIIACYSLSAGEKLWEKHFEGSQPVPVSNYVSRSAPTGCVDANMVYSFFEAGNLIALDHAGEVQWQRSLVDDFGKFLGNHGIGGSLAQTKDHVITLVDHDGPSYLIAFDKRTGETAWKVDREPRVSWSSPIVTDDGQILISSNGIVEAYDAANGKRIWWLEGLDGNTVAAPSYTRDAVVIGSSVNGFCLAIPRGQAGQLSIDQALWRSPDATSSFGSPLVHNDRAYFVNRSGGATCVNMRDGDTIWRQRLPASCWASPVAVGDRIYFFSNDGTTTVIKSRDQAEVVAENSLPTADKLYGVALANQRIVIREGSSLTCIADQRLVSDSRAWRETNRLALANEALNESNQAMPDKIPSLPQAVTSFGADAIGDRLYVYGGYAGSPHHYSIEQQSGDFVAVNWKTPATWEALPSGEKLQGFAMVNAGGKLYRMGGLTIRNRKEEDQDLWSIADVMIFDPDTNEWSAGPPLPEPRSSFEAAVIDDVIYIAGGWRLHGDSDDSEWLTSFYALDIKAEQTRWKRLPETPFERRAVSLGAQGGKVYVIGGMKSIGETTTDVACFDPATNTWSEGPTLPGKPLNGFGSAACVVDGRLHVSTLGGDLLRLTSNGDEWEFLHRFKQARFFHQMVALDNQHIAFIGGASMQHGKFDTTEIVNVSELSPQPYPVEPEDNSSASER